MEVWRALVVLGSQALDLTLSNDRVKESFDHLLIVVIKFFNRLEKVNEFSVCNFSCHNILGVSIH